MKREGSVLCEKTSRSTIVDIVRSTIYTTKKTIIAKHLSLKHPLIALRLGLCRFNSNAICIIKFQNYIQDKQSMHLLLTCRTLVKEIKLDTSFASFYSAPL